MSQNLDWPPADWSPVLVEIGRIVFNWNALELSFKRLLRCLAGVDDRGGLLTVHMGNIPACDAMAAIANDFLDGEEAESLRYFIRLYKIAYAYRNYYVHSFSGVQVEFVKAEIGGEMVDCYESKSALSVLENYSVRSRLVKHSEVILPEKAREVARMLLAVNSYTAKLCLHFMYPDKHELPERMPLPKELDKPREYPYGHGE